MSSENQDRLVFAKANRLLKVPLLLVLRGTHSGSHATPMGYASRQGKPSLLYWEAESKGAMVN
jgi:hypothetical protein